eukprot:NODE_2398_length_360_cov_86.678112_g2388_i0.p3 GENE.NODE_2398_length_360_cov_86.678112_g2388_i0~~NODE_2398_length_360_cov_86.678112_g2388_i0.p3  ORF type:complete len:55 (-),score=12.14 NODE_2398_length_360_cov_86.678112_g2388_i0:33-197(-)
MYNWHTLGDNYQNHEKSCVKKTQKNTLLGDEGTVGVVQHEFVESTQDDLYYNNM